MPDYEEADWSIPYCDFESTPDGFKVKFSRPRSVSTGWMLVGYGLALLVAFGSFILGFAVGIQEESLVAGIAVVAGSFFIGTGTLIAIYDRKTHSVIEVTPDSIIVDGKRLKRSAFSNFSIAHTRGKDGIGAVLGYGYGKRNFEFGGIWKTSDATEFLSSLNSRVRLVPRESEENRPSPELLRAARPTDF